MLCQTVKKDKDCFFWAKTGCTFEDGTCLPIVSQCEGCKRIEELPNGKFCMSYPIPAKHWTIGICNMATHIKIEEEATQKAMNPLKASKRGGKR